MKADFDYNQFPSGFASCFNTECLRGDICLHRQVALLIPKEREKVFAINPGHIESADGEGCTCFKLDEPQRYARGFSHLFDDLPVRKAEIVKTRMLSYMGRNTYYRCKQKVRMIKPAEQKFIKNLFLSLNINQEPQYDEYIEYYDLD